MASHTQSWNDGFLKFIRARLGSLERQGIYPKPLDTPYASVEHATTIIAYHCGQLLMRAVFAVVCGYLVYKVLGFDNPFLLSALWFGMAVALSNDIFQTKLYFNRRAIPQNHHSSEPRPEVEEPQPQPGSERSPAIVETPIETPIEEDQPDPDLASPETAVSRDPEPAGAYTQTLPQFQEEDTGEFAPAPSPEINPEMSLKFTDYERITRFKEELQASCVPVQYTDWEG